LLLIRWDKPPSAHYHDNGRLVDLLLSSSSTTDYGQLLLRASVAGNCHSARVPDPFSPEAVPTVMLLCPSSTSWWVTTMSVTFALTALVVCGSFCLQTANAGLLLTGTDYQPLSTDDQQLAIDDQSQQTSVQFQQMVTDQVRLWECSSWCWRYSAVYGRTVVLRTYQIYFNVIVWWRY